MAFDAAHVYIGYKYGVWTDTWIEEVLTSGKVAEFHFSSNNGKSDQHRPLHEHPISEIQDWIAIAEESGVEYFVDEGRRRH